MPRQDMQRSKQPPIDIDHQPYTARTSYEYTPVRGFHEYKAEEMRARLSRSNPDQKLRRVEFNYNFCDAIMRTVSPPREMTGNDVKTTLYSRMKVYSYKYVPSKLECIQYKIGSLQFQEHTYSKRGTRK